MEAQGRSGSFGFPGYDGSLPRAVRSSRGRGEGLRKPKDASKSMGFFELLATVAGQLLQEADKDELQKANLLGNHELAKSKTVDKKENSSAEKQNDLLSEEQIGALLNELHRGGKLLENRIENGKSGPESNILQRRCTSGDKSIHHVTHYYQQEAGDTVNSPYKKCTSQKCTFGRGQKSQNVTHEDHLLPECGDCVEDVASSKIGLEKWAMSSNNLFQSLQNCREDASMSHVNQLTVSVQAEVAATKLSCGFIEFGKRKGESEHDYDSFGRWIKSEEDVGFIEQGGPTFDYENPPLVSSGSSSGEAPMFTERKTSEMDSNLLKERRTGRRQDVPHPTRSKAKARDNDENTSESTVPETAPKKTTSKLSHMKALKARKLGNAANRLEFPGSGSKRKHSELEECSLEKDGRFHRVGKSHSRQRMTRFLAFKRKTVEGSSYDVPAWNLNTDGVASVENAGVDGEPPASAAKLRSAKAASFSSSPTSPASPSLKERGKKSSEPHIKLSIKSFTVPEFSVDLPESATIANLKRAVMEAAMNLFGGGLHVRVLLQGKKVSDESASLLQVGISQSRKMDSLGFMLEPSPLPTSPMNSEDPFLVLSSAASQPTSRHSVLSMDGDVDQNTFKGHNGNSNGTVETNASNDTGSQADAVKVKSDLDPSSNCLNGSLVPESRAIILHPSIGVEGVQDFALVPVHPKSQNVEMGKRRMRRPFSVAEVEALVQAVEKLGTGRWRDIKLQAFDQAKHRTYVDLKDKWKTLVHTAQIAPHQRRGEPVPQELLDRVTWAHSYWTAQQAKQQAELGM